jgi:hypothetical protein
VAVETAVVVAVETAVDLRAAMAATGDGDMVTWAGAIGLSGCSGEASMSRSWLNSGLPEEASTSKSCVGGVATPLFRSLNRGTKGAYGLKGWRKSTRPHCKTVSTHNRYNCEYA